MTAIIVRQNDCSIEVQLFIGMLVFLLSGVWTCCEVGSKYETAF